MDETERRRRISEGNKRNWEKRRKLYGPNGRRDDPKNHVIELDLAGRGRLTPTQRKHALAGFTPVKTADGRYAPGHSGNPFGSVRGRRSGTAHIWYAIERALEDREFDLFEHALTRAAVSDSVLNTLLNKLLPVKVETTVTKDVLEEATGFCKGVIATVKALLDQGSEVDSPQVKAMLESAVSRAEDLREMIEGTVIDTRIEIEFVDTAPNTPETVPEIDAVVSGDDQ